jgi:polyhydroxybutyrate depolymerase
MVGIRLKRPRSMTRRTAWRPLLVALLGLATVGALWDPGPALAGTAQTGSLSPGGLDRTYRIYVPAGYDATTAVPLVLVFHGGGGSGEQVARQTGFDAEAEREGFIAVYPDGTSRGRTDLLTWNAGHCCGSALAEGIDDVAFVAALLDQLETDYAIDPARVYATGFSNGAMLTHLLGCGLADRFAAIAPVSGVAPLDGCAPVRPLSVLHVHGTADRVAPYEGGFVPDSVPPRTDPAAADAVAHWQAANDCPAATVTTEGAITIELAEPCAAGTTVELMAVADGGHAWPGGRRPRPQADAPSAALDATETIWAFFAAHAAEA